MEEDALADVMSKELSRQLRGVRRSLVLREIAGDGHCQYRAVCVQCPSYGYAGSDRLRREVVTHVNGHQK